MDSCANGSGASSWLTDPDATLCTWSDVPLTRLGASEGQCLASHEATSRRDDRKGCVPVPHIEAYHADVQDTARNDFPRGGEVRY